MPKVTAHLSISLDGYVAGHHQTRGGAARRSWRGPAPLAPRPDRQRRRPRDDCADPRAARRLRDGAQHVRPRSWRWARRRWWGRCGAAGGARNPPYHAPVFVLTHYPHDPVEMGGGTTFHFVTSFEEAMERARRGGG